MIFDDLVLDVKDFMKNHPGGQFSIKENIGNDISKFFYGGYSLEPSSKLAPHTHSNIGRKIINTLVIGKLNYSAPFMRVKVKERIPINSTTSTIVFQALT